MHSSRGIWTAFVLLGMALFLSTVGFWNHPIYRTMLVLAFLLWSGYVMWTPTNGSEIRTDDDRP